MEACEWAVMIEQKSKPSANKVSALEIATW